MWSRATETEPCGATSQSQSNETSQLCWFFLEMLWVYLKKTLKNYAHPSQTTGVQGRSRWRQPESMEARARPHRPAPAAMRPYAYAWGGGGGTTASRATTSTDQNHQPDLSNQRQQETSGVKEPDSDLLGIKCCRAGRALLFRSSPNLISQQQELAAGHYAVHPVNSSEISSSVAGKTICWLGVAGGGELYRAHPVRSGSGRPLCCVASHRRTPRAWLTAMAGSFSPSHHPTCAPVARPAAERRKGAPVSSLQPLSARRCTRRERNTLVEYC